MSDVTLVIACLLGGALVGELERRHCVTLTYRYPTESEIPAPAGSRWWITFGAAAAAGLLAWRFGSERLPLLLPTLPIALFGTWLSAIDWDVRRLPNRILLAHGLAVAAGAGLAAALMSDPQIAIRAAIGGLIAVAVFWVLHLLTKSGIGWGDGKYSLVLGAATAAVGYPVEWWSFMLGCLAAVIAAIALRARSFAFGPWLFVGSIAAIATFG